MSEVADAVIEWLDSDDGHELIREIAEELDDAWDDEDGTWYAANAYDKSGAFRRNWIQQTGSGHLPRYIKRIEKHLKQKGMTEQRAIATAVNVVKKMCANPGDRLNFPGSQRKVNPKSIGEACKAVAEWDAKRAEARATPNKGRGRR